MEDFLWQALATVVLAGCVFRPVVRDVYGAPKTIAFVTTITVVVFALTLATAWGYEQVLR